MKAQPKVGGLGWDVDFMLISLESLASLLSSFLCTRQAASLPFFPTPRTTIEDEVAALVLVRHNFIMAGTGPTKTPS